MGIKADNGDSYSANMLGCRLQDGTPPDLVATIQSFRRAATGGDMPRMIIWAAASSEVEVLI
jgi:hypothetical protein